MSEPLDQSGIEGGASDTPPATSAQPDLDAVIQSAVQAALKGVDQRFSGFQSVIDRKIAEVSRSVGDLRKAALPPEELAAEDQTALAQEIEALRQRNAMLELRRDHPEAVDFLMDLFSEDKQSFEAQIAFIEDKFGPKAAAQVEAAVEAAAEASNAAPAVDPNNPARKQDVALATAAAMARNGNLTEEAAMAILNSAGKGSLSSR